MTARSLARWAESPGISIAEKAQRGTVQERILSQARRLPSAELSTADDVALVCQGSLVIDGFDALTSLPEGLHVKGTLCVANCVSLLTLPAWLRVEGLLIAEGCTSLNTIDPSIWVRGATQFDGCINLTSLPQTLLRCELPNGKRIIDLNDTGISQELADKLRRVPSVHINFYGHRLPLEDLQSLQAAHVFWQQHSPGSAASPSPLPSTASALLALSLALQSTAHFIQPQARPSLAARVLSLFAACSNRDVAPDLVGRIEEALSQGDDLVQATLPQLEEAIAVHHALRSDTPEASLRHVGKARLAQLFLAELAAEHAARLSTCDGMEVVLAYTAGLHDRLGLHQPCNYAPGSLLQVTDADLNAAERRTRLDSQAHEATFMTQWPVLQRHQREVACAAQAYDALPTLGHALDLPSNTVCPITQADVTQLQRPVAVVCGEHATVYEHHALMAWWTRHGTDGMNAAMDLTQLHRLT